MEFYPKNPLRTLSWGIGGVEAGSIANSFGGLVIAGMHKISDLCTIK